MFEVLTNLYFYVKYRAKIKNVRNIIKPIDLLNFPDKDNTLVPVKIYDKCSIPISAYIVNKIPDDEYSEQGARLKVLIKILNTILKYSKNNNYYITSDNECIELYKKLYKDYFNTKPLQILLTDNNLSLINGPFCGSITRIGDKYYVNSSHMLRYEYKEEYLIPAIKAEFKIDGNELQLIRIIHNNKEYTDKNNIAYKLLHNYLLIDTVINKHLIITHLKVAELFSFAIRKYLSANNPVKHFLWNFCLGVHVTNSNLIPLLFNKVQDFFPFTKNGLANYINESVRQNHLRWLFPDNEIKSDLTGDQKKIFDIFKNTVKSLLLKINEEAVSEVAAMVGTVKNFVTEYQGINMIDVIASFMYVSSVLHYTSNHMLFDYVINGYSYPVAVKKNGQIHKYNFLHGLETLLESMLPMRKLVYIMRNMHPSAKEEYETMIHELLHSECKVIDILQLEGGVQI